MQRIVWCHRVEILKNALRVQYDIEKKSQYTIHEFKCLCIYLMYKKIIDTSLLYSIGMCVLSFSMWSVPPSTKTMSIIQYLRVFTS